MKETPARLLWNRHRSLRQIHQFHAVLLRDFRVLGHCERLAGAVDVRRQDNLDLHVLSDRTVDQGLQALEVIAVRFREQWVERDDSSWPDEEGQCVKIVRLDILEQSACQYLCR